MFENGVRRFPSTFRPLVRRARLISGVLGAGISDESGSGKTILDAPFLYVLVWCRSVPQPGSADRPQSDPVGRSQGVDAEKVKEAEGILKVEDRCRIEAL